MALVYGVIYGPTSSENARVSWGPSSYQDFIKSIGESAWGYAVELPPGEYNFGAEDRDSDGTDGPAPLTVPDQAYFSGPSFDVS